MSSSHQALLRLEQLSFSYPQQPEPLFTQVTAALAPGWYGLVGDNGAGKSTLLGLIAGQLKPEGGSVWSATPARLCEQDVFDGVALREEVMERWDARAMKLRSVLALDDEALWRWESCSGGERKRWQIGAVLMSACDILLLDEPTNHLDAEGRARLIEAMSEHRGVGVVVSHDRALLDAVTQRTLWLESGQLSDYSGGYSEAARQRAEEHATRRHERAVLVARHDALHGALKRQRRAREGAEAQRSARRRMKSSRDSDARSVSAKGRVARAEGSLGARVGALSGTLARLSTALEATPPVRERASAMSLERRLSPHEIVAHLELPQGLSAGPRRLLDELIVTLRRDDRVWLRGPNGAGKSALLEAIYGSLDVSQREGIFYLPQELKPAQRDAMLLKLAAIPPAKRGAKLALAARLGVDIARLLDDGAASPGVCRKVMVAMALGEGAWCAMLDEPTNHLDLGAIEAMESALSGYGGALLIVTHDEALGRAVCHTAWRLDPQRRRLSVERLD